MSTSFTLLLISLMSIFTTTQLSKGMDSKQLFEQLERTASGWDKDRLAKMLIVPLLLIDGEALSTNGYGELSKDDAKSFVAFYKTGQKEVLSSSLAQGVTVNVYFLYEERGFRKEDVWMCKMFGKDVVAIFIVDDGRIYIRLPEKAAEMIASHFIKNVEK